jgi:S-adenosyl-L-methionine hydrolase (adenosine-forming)
MVSAHAKEQARTLVLEYLIQVRSRIVTILTDFGSADYFVGAVKGVILSRSPSVTLVDITHSIPHQDIRTAAFILNGAYPYFPAGSIHLAVVDPGVGSHRRPIIVETPEYLFVGPDNGLFSIILEQASEARVRHVTNSKYFLPNPSSTFHGRDLFAPVAAALASGIVPETFGPIINDPVRLKLFSNELATEGAVVGSIIHVDHFGNCVTSIESDRLRMLSAGQGFCLSVKGIEIRRLQKQYLEAGNPDEPFVIPGSAGYLEISLPCSSAAKELNISLGNECRLGLDIVPCVPPETSS